MVNILTNALSLMLETLHQLHLSKYHYTVADICFSCTSECYWCLFDYRVATKNLNKGYQTFLDFYSDQDTNFPDKFWHFARSFTWSIKKSQNFLISVRFYRRENLFMCKALGDNEIHSLFHLELQIRHIHLSLSTFSCKTKNIL